MFAMNTAAAAIKIAFEIFERVRAGILGTRR